jgi:hypothetical protein
VSIAQFRAGQFREEPMTVTTIILLINAMAELIESVACLIGAIRHARRRCA